MISNWLEMPAEGMEKAVQHVKKKFLELCLYGLTYRVQNAQEMVDQLKKVKNLKHF